VIVVVVVVLELWTGWNYYGSLAKKVGLLKELHALAKDHIAANPQLYRIYRETEDEVAMRRVSPFAIPSLSPSVTFWKAVTGSLFWFVLLLAVLFGSFGEKDRIGLAIFMVVLGGLFGFAGTLIRTLYRPWVNYIAFPIAQLLGVVFLGSRIKKAKES